MLSVWLTVNVIIIIVKITIFCICYNLKTACQPIWILNVSPAKFEKKLDWAISAHLISLTLTLINRDKEYKMIIKLSWFIKSKNSFILMLKSTVFCPGWCGSVDWTPAWEPKGHQFNSQSGHMPRLQARSPVGGAQEATTHWCFSPSLSPSLPLSNKILKNK